MKVYTKFGDQGKTRLVGGECVNKDNPRVDCYGTVDELNSFIGLALSELQQLGQDIALGQLQKELIRIQHELFNLGSLLACEKKDNLPMLPRIEAQHIESLEKSIDEMTRELPVLKNFILPGGSSLSSLLHVARTVCRRAERQSVGLIGALKNLSDEEKQVLDISLIYLNRLSDYFFTAARFSNLKLGQSDQLWKKSAQNEY